MGDLTQNFSSWEFRCPCGCGRDNISLELVQKLQRVRNRLFDKLGKKRGRIRIASGVRCPAYNAEVGGVEDSAHVKSLAADPIIEDSEWAYWFLVYAPMHFQRIGYGKLKGIPTMHVDIDLSKPNPRFWPY